MRTVGSPPVVRRPSSPGPEAIRRFDAAIAADQRMIASSGWVGGWVGGVVNGVPGV
jgi:hypothetical protein